MLITILNTAFCPGLQKSMNTIYVKIHTNHLLNCLKHTENIGDGGGTEVNMQEQRVQFSIQKGYKSQSCKQHAKSQAVGITQLCPVPNKNSNTTTLEQKFIVINTYVAC